MAYTFDREKHIKYLNGVIKSRLGKGIVCTDTIRMTVVLFSLSSFDVLDSFDEMRNWNKKKIIDTIYSYQIEDDLNDEDELGRWGFRSSFSNGVNNKYDLSHIAITYCALCSLLICGDDLKRVNRTRITRNLGKYQKANGCFFSSPGGESDMRFIYCAAGICFILNDFSSIDQEQMIKYIMNSLTYEGAFAQNPGNEAHGGSTYCALASLKLLGKLDECLSEQQKSRLIRWCLNKQCYGFEGRPNKDSDTCYTFWIGASLAMLGKHHLINHERLKMFCLRNQDAQTGGFSKVFDCAADILHTCLGLHGLALEVDNEFDLQRIVPELNLSERSFQHLQKIIASYE